MNIWMNEVERDMITSYLDSDDVMLEYGAGGSTLYFSQYVSEYYSIEHDPVWYSRVLEDIPSNVVLLLVEPDIPLPDATAVFKDAVASYKQYESYIHSVESFQRVFDKVLIDGRARAYCAEAVLPFLADDAVVFIHDYMLRPRYHWIEEYYSMIDYVDTGQSLAVFNKR
jgi:hypothetical protein